MDHGFNVEMAAKYGLPVAILFRNFQYWIAKNKADGRHCHDGRTWTYNTRKGLREIFPYMGETQIRAAIKKLLDAGILRKGNYNRQQYDRTTWYAFEEEESAFLGFPAHWLKQPMHWSKQPMEGAKTTNALVKTTNGRCENNQTIPDIRTDNKPNKKPDNRKFSNSDLSDDQREALSLLYRYKVSQDVAKSLVFKQHTPPESIRNAILNGTVKEAYAKRTGGTWRLGPPYIVAALNMARQEGKIVKPTEMAKTVAKGFDSKHPRRYGAGTNNTFSERIMP